MPELTLICAPIAPFAPDGGLDLEGHRALFENLRDSGVHHVFVPGTTAEFTSMDDAERLAVIRTALEVFGADGVFAHVGAATARQAVALARQAVDLGATRLAAITPYFITAGPGSVIEYYRAIAEAVPGAEIYAYVFPDRATTQVSPETMAQIAAIPGLAGAKLSGMSTEVVSQYIAAVPSDFKVFSGNDREVIRLAAAGGAGIVSGVSNVFPGIFVKAVQALNAGEDATALQDEIDESVDSVGGGDIGLLKAGVALRGLPAGPLRVSVEAPAAGTLERLEASLSRRLEEAR